MRDYWITTHWPTPATEPGLSRHVYVKERNVKLPKPDDFVFFRESISVTVNRKHPPTVRRRYLGKEDEFDVPRGKGGIIGTATVDGARRPIRDDDVVFDFGNLREWSIIPCRDFQPASLSLEDLLALLGKVSPRFLSLWRMPSDGSKLLKALHR